MKKIVVFVPVILILAFVLLAEAQQQAKVARIGVLGYPLPHRIDAFRQGLRDHGWIEGQNIVIDYRLTEGSKGLSQLAPELVRLQVDVIVAAATDSAVAAQKATRAIPIVMASVADPVGVGLVASLARPGGNITGLTNILPEIGGKGLELLKEVVPKLSRVAYLGNPTNPGHVIALREVQAAAQVLGVTLQSVEVRGSKDFDWAFGALGTKHTDALLVQQDHVLFSHRTRIVDFAAKNRLPAMYMYREWADAGGLLAYGASLREVYKRVAAFVDKILKGAKPADLPVEQPTKFELVINLKTAKQIGLKIPPDVLMWADEVIK